MKMLLQYGNLGYYVGFSQPLTKNPVLAHEFDDLNEPTWLSVLPDWDGVEGKYVAMPDTVSVSTTIEALASVVSTALKRD